QSFRLTTLTPKYSFMLSEFGKLILLNIIYWYIPAALSPIMFRLAHRFRLDGSQKIQAFAIHALAALTYSAVHFGGMMGARMLMWGMPKPASVPWLLFVQRQYLTQLDWTLMTYTTIVALSYALHYSKKSHA